jgi:WD40 repeat protein
VQSQTTAILFLAAGAVLWAPPASRAAEPRLLRSTEIGGGAWMAASSDGRLVALSTGTGVRLWDATTGRDIATLPHKNLPRVAVSADGTRVATSDFNEVKLWDAQGKMLRSWKAQLSWIEALAISGTGHRVATAGLDAKVRLWPAAGGKALHEMGGFEFAVRAVSLSPDGRWAAALTEGGTVMVWNARTGREQITFTTPAASRILLFTPDSLGLVVGDGKGAAALLNPLTARRRRLFATGDDGGTTAAALSPDVGGTVTVWKVADASPIASIPGDSSVGSLALLADGSVVTNRSGTVEVWRIPTP